MHLYAQEANSHPHLSRPPLRFSPTLRRQLMLSSCCIEVLSGYCLYEKLPSFITSSILLFRNRSTMEEKEGNRNGMMSNSIPLVHSLWSSPGMVLPSENCTQFPFPHLPSLPRNPFFVQTIAADPPPHNTAQAPTFPHDLPSNAVLTHCLNLTENLDPSTCIVSPIIRISPFHGLA